MIRAFHSSRQFATLAYRLTLRALKLEDGGPIAPFEGLIHRKLTAGLAQSHEHATDQGSLTLYRA